MKKYIKYSGIVIFLIILLKINFRGMLRTLYEIHSSYLLIAVTLNIPLLFSKSYRWHSLLKQQAIQYNVLQSCLVYMSSLYVGFITPGRLGEFTKAIYLKLDKNISLSKGMSSVVVDRLLDMYLLIILGIVEHGNLVYWADFQVYL